MVLILIPATVLALIPLVASLFVKNIALDNVRNVVEDADVVSLDRDSNSGVAEKSRL